MAFTPPFPGVKNQQESGAPVWLSRVQCLTLDFCSGQDLRVVRLNPMSAALSWVWNLFKSLSLPLSKPQIYLNYIHFILDEFRDLITLQLYQCS